MCMQLILGLKPPCSGWISDVWVERRDKISFSNTLLITDRRVIPRKFEGLVKSAFLPLGMGTMRPSWKDVGMWPDSRIELKMTFRMLAVKGCENIRCSLLRLSGPAAFPRGKENITLSIASVLIRSGSTSGRFRSKCRVSERQARSVAGGMEDAHRVSKYYLCNDVVREGSTRFDVLEPPRTSV